MQSPTLSSNQHTALRIPTTRAAMIEMCIRDSSLTTHQPIVKDLHKYLATTTSLVGMAILWIIVLTVPISLDVYKRQGFCCSAPLTLPVRSGARPAPAATGRPRACQSNRRTPSARRARTATGTHLPTPAAAQNTPRIAASAFLPSGCKIIMHLDNFRS